MNCFCSFATVESTHIIIIFYYTAQHLPCTRLRWLQQNTKRVINFYAHRMYNIIADHAWTLHYANFILHMQRPPRKSKFSAAVDYGCGYSKHVRIQRREFLLGPCVTNLSYVCVEAASVDSIQATTTAPAKNASSFEHDRRGVYQRRVSSTQGGGSRSRPFLSTRMAGEYRGNCRE